LSAISYQPSRGAAVEEDIESDEDGGEFSR
jgi:hypothetical protein